MLSYKRDTYCGQVTENLAGREVHLSGWVQRARDLGGVVFVWLRDREGLVQLVFDEAVCSHEVFELGRALRSEYVVTCTGEVRMRAENAVNPDLPTGKVEVFVRECELLNKSETPPIYIDDKARKTRRCASSTAISTCASPPCSAICACAQRSPRRCAPTWTVRALPRWKRPCSPSPPPRARAISSCPAACIPGSFYALPQSPQIYKQLLMLAGFDKYYQLARCFRDEDNRADRQPEFTQVDVEMSFIDEKDIQTVIEGAFQRVFHDVMGMDIQLPLERITWREAMENYGSDKPDRRFGMLLKNASDLCEGCGFPVFEDAVKEGKCVRGINAEGCADMTRKQIDSLVEFVKTYRAKGLAYVTYTADGGVKSSFNKFLTPEFAEKLRERFGAKPGDILFFVADKDAVAFQSLGALRIEIARRRGLIPEGVYDLFWVTEFPLFEYSEEEGRYVAMHHPFTSWMPEDEAYLENEKDKVRARAYDLVMNGIEMGSGSIRIHRSDMQAKMFKMIGLSDEEAQHRFGFLTDAFKYGTPPHGGFAFGLDRLSMILTGSDSLRDVVAFPKAQGANCLMMETPADVNPEQLEALKIKVDLGE